MCVGGRCRTVIAMRITEPEFLVPGKDRIPCFSRQTTYLQSPDQIDPHRYLAPTKANE
jgi:hypothetical protein